MSQSEEIMCITYKGGDRLASEEKASKGVEDVFATYGNMLYRIAFVMMKNQYDAEDAVQDTLIKYMERRKSFEGEEHRKAWLIRVTINGCKNRLRFYKNHPDISMEELSPYYPMELKGMGKKQAKERAGEFIAQVGLGNKIYGQFPRMMSGGEQQRVAIARALASEGKILLADEPTGNLDTENERNIVDILKKAAHDRGYTMIVITHNPEVAKEADCVYRMRDGHLEREERDA